MLDAPEAIWLAIEEYMIGEKFYKFLIVLVFIWVTIFIGFLTLAMFYIITVTTLT